MRTHLLAAAAVCAGALLVPAAPALAADSGTVHIGRCPASRTLATVADVIAHVDWRAYTPDERAAVEAQLASTAVDLNQDGLLCYSPQVQNAGRDKKYGVPDYRVLVIGDNTVVGR